MRNVAQLSQTVNSINRENKIMQIETGDLGAQKSPRSGAPQEEGADRSVEEQKRLEGASQANDKPFEGSHQMGELGGPSGQHHLISDSFAQADFANGQVLQVKSKRGLCMAIKRQN
mmetsp:Transcript_4674/g.6163  ORF Transcript_4674/g.6163 Transcript_4674/m.6163 type:complete len:116 (-) Transcript_4674:246-593(-)